MGPPRSPGAASPLLRQPSDGLALGSAAGVAGAGKSGPASEPQGFSQLSALFQTPLLPYCQLRHTLHGAASLGMCPVSSAQ